MMLRHLSGVFALLAFASHAHANGRFPRAQRVIEDAADPTHLIVGGTYGMLQTTDGGKSWHLLCESSFAGEMLGTFDCMFDLASGGALLAAYGDAMSRSEAPGCNFAPVLGGDMLNRVVDFSVSASDSANVLALVSRRPSGGQGVSALTLSTDAGAHFEELGELPSVRNFATTVDRAPSDPDRVYVSGLDDTGEPVLLVSADGGLDFDAHPIRGLGASGFLETPYIAAVHPTRADVVFVRTVGQMQQDVPMPNDALLVTFDAGVTWQELLRGGAELYGFALSPDATRVWAGYGNPRDLPVDSEALGIYYADLENDGVGSFTHATHEAVSCLEHTGQGLYVCATDFEVGFQLGLRADGDVSGGLASFTPLLELADVRGPEACPTGSTGELCTFDWPTSCATFQASCDGNGAAAGTGGTGAAGSGGAAGGGAVSSGGTPSSGGVPSGGAPTTGGGADVGASAGTRARQGRSSPRSSGGCGIANRPSGSYVAVMALLIAGVRRRRRARDASKSAENALAHVVA